LTTKSRFPGSLAEGQR